MRLHLLNKNHAAMTFVLSIPFITTSFLLISALSEGWELILIYIAYFLSFCVLSHYLALLSFVALPQELRIFVPKGLEYLYILAISISVLQISTNYRATEVFKSFALGNIGDNARSIISAARDSEREHCRKREQYFDPLYCRKLHELGRSTVEGAISIANDDTFYNHTFGKQWIPMPPGGSIQVDKYADFRVQLVRVRTLHSAKIAAATYHDYPIWDWMFFILLPVGLGIRILKTSYDIALLYYANKSLYKMIKSKKSILVSRLCKRLSIHLLGSPAE